QNDEPAQNADIAAPQQSTQPTATELNGSPAPPAQNADIAAPEQRQQPPDDDIAPRPAHYQPTQPRPTTARLGTQWMFAVLRTMRAGSMASASYSTATAATTGFAIPASISIAASKTAS